MILNTYFSPFSANRTNHEPELVKLWSKTWEKHGVVTNVMGPDDVIQHIDFERYHAAISKLPTVNRPEYEQACFDRWISLCAIGGGFMCDYDIFPTAKFKMDEFYHSFTDVDKLHIFQTGAVVPSLIWANQHMAKWACDNFATGKFGHRVLEGRKHCSDMYALQDMFSLGLDCIVAHDTVRDYKRPGWDKCSIIHFNTESMTGAGKMPKYQFIPEILESINP